MKHYYVVLGTVAASMATLVLTITMVDPSPAPSDPFSGMRMSAPELYEVIDDEVLNAPVVSYKSETFGYKLKYPGTWELDDSHEEFNGDIVSDPDERVIITISRTDDERLLEPSGLEYVAKSIEESLRFDSGFDLTTFDHLVWKNYPTIYTDGIRRIGGKRFRTREYNILRASHGGFLNISITSQEDSEVLYGKALQTILGSLEVCPK